MPSCTGNGWPPREKHFVTVLVANATWSLAAFGRSKQAGLTRSTCRNNLLKMLVSGPVLDSWPWSKGQGFNWGSNTISGMRAIFCWLYESIAKIHHMCHGFFIRSYKVGTVAEREKPNGPNLAADLWLVEEAYQNIVWMLKWHCGRDDLAMAFFHCTWRCLWTNVRYCLVFVVVLVISSRKACQGSGTVCTSTGIGVASSVSKLFLVWNVSFMRWSVCWKRRCDCSVLEASTWWHLYQMTWMLSCPVLKRLTTVLIHCLYDAYFCLNDWFMLLESNHGFNHWMPFWHDSKTTL